MVNCKFPESFLWGTATSSYQIEGAIDADGKGPSNWDAFCRLPGRTQNGDSGRFACDHYHRYAEDVELLARLGIQSYRFSISWPRIFPQGRGRLNDRGIDFYDRLVDSLLARGIAPSITCYHWDLPKALEDAGGWRSRDTVDAFEEYCRVLAQWFGDRVEMWYTINEIPVVWKAAYTLGIHAPGLRLDEKGSRQVCHHLLVAHGKAVRALRENSNRPIRVGLVNNTTNFVPFSESEKHVEAAREEFHKNNAWILDPVLGSGYPGDEWESLGANIPDIYDGDEEIMSTPTDFLGLNLYSATDVVHAKYGVRPVESWFPRTDFAWPVVADTLYWSTRFTSELYAPKAIYITENGCCYPDQVNEEGRVEDYARINFLKLYLQGLHRAVGEGYPACGYFLWSALDNFEWAAGFSKRFGIIHVNFETLERRPKLSAEWYAEVVRNGGF